MALTRRFGDAQQSGLNTEENGTFRCSYGLEPLFLFLSAAFFVGGLITAYQAAGLLLGSITQNYDEDNAYLIASAVQNSSMFMALVWLAVIVIAGFLAWLFFKLTLNGKLYRWTADEKWFSVHDGSEMTSILFAEVNSVDYEPLRFMFQDRGYKVTIKTTYREYKYSYIFPKNAAKRTPETSPFFIIEVRAGLYKDFSWSHNN